MVASGYSLKDQLFNAEKVRYLAGLFGAASDEFDAASFEADVMARLADLELKQRIDHIAVCLAARLPDDLPDAAPVLLAALPDPLSPDLTDDDFGDFIFAPLGEYVARAGVAAYPDLSLDLIEALTQRFSMEWAIRPFLNAWPEKVLMRLTEWAGHPSYHVRRLVCEGTRPRLPWGMGVELAVHDPLPLLDRLYADRTRYVTRSVANHLNDIARTDADLVLARLAAWQAEGAQDPAELRWLIRHALRGAIKAGHPGAMVMLGFDPDADLTARLQLADPKPCIGGALQFAAHLSGNRGQKVLVDYRLHFPRPGGRVSVKVFKLKQSVIGSEAEAGTEPGTEAGQLVIAKVHKLKGNASTFTLCPGEHRLDLMVNGRLRDSVLFDLQAPQDG